MLTSLQLEILLALAQAPLHGYGIKLDIERRNEGEIELTSGALYQALYRLEKKGLVAEAPAPTEASDDPRRGRYYRLSGEGREQLGTALRRLSRLVEEGVERNLLEESS